MRFALKTILLLILASFLTAAPLFAQGNLPKLKQASFVESYSPAEWMVKAAGVGGGKKKYREKNAIEDARKSAVYFCLYLGTDPLFNTAEEKSRFAFIEQDFFDINNVNKYVSWESAEFTLRVKISGGKELKIEKVFRINVGILKEDLINQGVLMATADLVAEIGLPQILVLPEVPKGGNPLEAMQNRSELKHASRSIESYLTAQKYEVIVPEQQDFLNNYTETMHLVEGTGEDMSYKIALAIGSDVYITYSVYIERRMVGSTENKKASVSVRAYETTTARLLGTETGYSYERPSPDEVVVEEAIHDAIDKVLSRVNAYWKEDLQRGVQYKIIFSITGMFDEDEVEDIQFALSDVIDAFATRSKENIVTDQTMDYQVWVKPSEYDKARDLYRDIKDDFAAEISGAKVRRQQINRKLLLLEVVND
ncbi:hypothetical protein CEE37_01350 [candidate division LCP-89 bacterium B3_LCP]|uniref:Flagellar assembly protein T N-terminal domain-containing protein n=1 Tax=candidate division LCP-89 bacterium B3_LCP TaxID=2012998 RepID=A0A532V583_UNCL8|nr:MAG: hypothetical protein CEE37_01350 [candidate division LCP-89 bacterium B3_LCP]